MAEDTLKKDLERIRDERGTHANTATRIGNALLALLARMENALSLSALSAYFLSKQNDDKAAGEIGFLKGLWVKAKGAFGIDGNGDARLHHLDVDGKETADTIVSRIFTAMNGMAGNGFRLRYADGRGELQVDDLYVLGRMLVNTLEIREVSYIGGVYLLTPAGSRAAAVVPLYAEDGTEANTAGWRADPDEVDDPVVAGYRIYVLADDGTTATMNYWQAGDQAFCQTFNVTEPGTYDNVQNSHWWRLVVATGSVSPEDNVLGDGKGYHYVDVADCAFVRLYNSSGRPLANASGGFSFAGRMTGTNTVPRPGDRLVCLGSQLNADRQAAVQISAEGIGSIDIFDGINNYASLDTHTVHSLNRRKVVMSANRFEWKTYDGESKPPTVYRGDWHQGAVSQWGDEWSYDGGRWLCILPTDTVTDDGTGITREAPGTTPAWWTDMRGPKGDSTETYELLATPGSVVFNTVTKARSTERFHVEVWHNDSMGSRSHLHTIPAGLRLMRNMLTAAGGENGNTDRSGAYTNGQLQQACTVQGLTNYDYYQFELQRVVEEPVGTCDYDDDGAEITEAVTSYQTLATLTVPISKVADGSDGASVVAQYSPTDSPASDSQIHSAYQLGDLFIRMRLTNETFSGRVDAGHPWIRIVGEEGAAGPGTDYKDFKFGWSTQLTTASVRTAPTLAPGTTWTDAPAADPGTDGTRYYLWMQIMPMRWDKESRVWIPQTSQVTYQRIRGEDGADGQDGNDGADGKDGVSITVSPGSLIFEEELDSNGDPVIDTSKWGNTADILFMAGADNKSYDVFPSATRSLSGCNASLGRAYVSGVGYVLRVTVDGVTKSGNAYARKGYVDVNIPYDGKNYRCRVNFYVNMLGTFKRTVEGDVESSVAEQLTYGYDNLTGDAGSLKAIGKYIRSSEQNLQQLTSSVDGVTSRMSEIRQTVNSISLGVEDGYTANPNLIPDSLVEQTTNSYGGNDASRRLPADLVQGHTYTLQACGHIDAQAVADGKTLKVYVHDGNWTNEATQIITIDSTQRTVKSLTFTVAGSYTDWYVEWYLYPSGGSRTGRVTLDWIKLEEGSEPTPWVPYAGDARYRNWIDNARGADALLPSSLLPSDTTGYDTLGYDSHHKKSGYGTAYADLYEGRPGFSVVKDQRSAVMEALQYTVTNLLAANTWYTLEWFSQSDEGFTTYIYPSCLDTSTPMIVDGITQSSCPSDGNHSFPASTGFVRHQILFRTASDTSGYQKILWRIQAAQAGRLAVTVPTLRRVAAYTEEIQSMGSVLTVGQNSAGSIYAPRFVPVIPNEEPAGKYLYVCAVVRQIRTGTFNLYAGTGTLMVGSQHIATANVDYGYFLTAGGWYVVWRRFLVSGTLYVGSTGRLLSAIMAADWYLLSTGRWQVFAVAVMLGRKPGLREIAGTMLQYGIRRTGIDIENGVIRAQTDNFRIVNSDGKETFSVDADGNIVGMGNATFDGVIRAKSLFQTYKLLTLYYDMEGIAGKTLMQSSELVALCGGLLPDVLYLHSSMDSSEGAFQIQMPQAGDNDGRRIVVYGDYNWNVGTKSPVWLVVSNCRAFMSSSQEHIFVFNSWTLDLHRSTGKVELISDGTYWNILACEGVEDRTAF